MTLPDLPLLVVVACDTFAPRTVDSVLASLRRGDHVVVVPQGLTPVPSNAVADRRVSIEPAGGRPIAWLAADHADATGGATVVIECGAAGFGNRWLGDLVRSLGRFGAVAAAGNGAPWPVAPVDLPDLDRPRSEFRDLARRLAVRSEEVGPIHELDGPCYVLAPDAARAIGSSSASTATEIGAAVTAAGLALGVADGVYVHDERVRPLLSACMIMKDEEENLARCLATIVDLVDEVVIYDTGSTDGSVELARSLGAVVVPGFWDDDFGRARNAARAACRGRWLLHLDADEDVEMGSSRDAASFRAFLEQVNGADLIALALYNMMGTELAPVRATTPFQVPRLLRRAVCHWTGALHEHPALANGRGTPGMAPTDLLTLVHWGYLDEVMERRGKGARNARIADTRLTELDDVGRVCFDQARTRMLNADPAGAVELFARAVDEATNPIHVRCALEKGAGALIQLGRHEEAAEWIDRRAAIDDFPGVPRWLRATLAMAQGRFEDALVDTKDLTDWSDRYTEMGPEVVHTLRAQAHLRLDRLDDGSDELLAAFRAKITHDPAWMLMIGLSERDPAALARVAEIVPAESLKLLAGKLLNVPAPIADRVAEALWNAHEGAPVLLAFASTLGQHVELERAAVWAMRIRTAGLVSMCPLRQRAHDSEAAPRDRLQAAYLGAELFDDAELRAIVSSLGALHPASH